MRPIDGDALDQSIIRYAESKHFNGDYELASAILKSRDKIREAPTIDAVPVIRCLSCAWRSSTGLCYKHGHMVADDFFCAHGTTENVKKSKPAKVIEKKTEERCMATGLACSRCKPGPCDHRKTST